ncbi:HVA22-like protein [Rhynchospora pubera]|uniref:HVA22-like protein n=1 Tax=Rhynchospora pubera TaxID=906938 RepID=A0AAV8DJN0_9POAL|nr:HVA22-like protein [Rhynchospora pubera]KAJ4819432.1 HVA22-like protein [Rhynchospora pubera]
MLGEFLTATLTLLFGYAYPAFECFKMVEKRPGRVEQLRFWCQYWIIVAIVLVLESLLSWLPMYGEIKLAFFVYLWYPKTKGSDLVYDTFLKPFVMQYEPNIEQRLGNLRAKSGQILVFYIKNFTDKGTAFFLQVLNQVVSPTPSREPIRYEEKAQPAWSPSLIKKPRYKEPKMSDDYDIDAAIAESLRTAAATARAKPKRPHYLTTARR